MTAVDVVVVAGYLVTSFLRLVTNCLGVEVKMRNCFRNVDEIEIVPEWHRSY
jgi:hypothetical protein